MKEKTISCYLCGGEAVEQSDYEEGKVTHNTIIQCTVNCPPYETTTESRKFYLSRELTDDEKNKLIEFLKKNYKGEPIRLTAYLIKNLIGR